MINIIKQKIKNKFSPEILEIIDQSKLHIGHNNLNKNNNTHFKIRIRIDTLKNKTSITKHRMIMNLFKNEFNNGLHALSIELIN